MKDVTPKAHRCTLGGCPAILEVTPQDMRCEVGASCPSVFEVTPEAMKCHVGESCPSLYETTPETLKCGALMSSCPALYEQQDGHIVIGKVMTEIPEEVAKRIGPDEFAVWVPQGLIMPDDGGNGAAWFNGFQEVDNWLNERDWWVESDIHPTNPAETLLSGLRRKEAEIAALREALKPFARIAGQLEAEDQREGWEPLDGRESLSCQEMAERGVPDMILLGDLRRAHKALEDIAHGCGPVPEEVAPPAQAQDQSDQAGGRSDQ